MKSNLLPSICLAILILAGCTTETQLPNATGKGSVQAINAIRTAPQLSFLIEERTVSGIDYKDSSGTTSYDDLEYTFNFEAILEGDTQTTRIASQFLDVVKDTTYTLVISGQLANPTVSVWERPDPDFPDGATNFEVQVGHLSASTGDLDVYFSDPATPPALGNELGTLSFGEILPISSLEAGDFVITLTAPGDPATVLFESSTITTEAGTALMFAAFDPDARDLSPMALQLFNLSSGGSGRVADANFPPTIRFFHASPNAGDVDIYSDDPLTAPIVAGHSFGDITPDTDMPIGLVPLTYTSADNVGVIVAESDRVISAGVRYFSYLLEVTSGSPVIVSYIPDIRSVETVAKLSVIQTLSTGTRLDVYVVPAGEAIDEATPLLRDLPAGLDPVNLTLVAGTIDIYVTPVGDKTVLAGPIQQDLANGDVVQAVIYENVDPTVVDVVLFPIP